MGINGLFQHDDMIPDINSMLDTLCRGEWELSALAEEMGFVTEHPTKSRGIKRYKFPPVVRFGGLFNGYSYTSVINGSVPYTISIGIRRTELDPLSGRVVPYFDPDEVKTGYPSEEDATAFVQLQYVGPKELIVREIQALRIHAEYEEEVLAEMQGQPANEELSKRINNMEEYGIPWTHSERMLLFGPVAVWCAKQLRVPELTVREHNYPIYDRVQDFLENHTHTNGVDIHYGVRPTSD